ncbi:MAG: crossover junction endodeoxyribonuclease RuvC [Gammaproteobacteria bacterium RIFOXYA12_FULL_61_12]|nr:MAG: crossover junction endodeoxyribonuclease RuvC [Gammaproteobacteria bacterium RIFOXYD12_FULL_61_37]OGT93849.1 MAG: crossover junction endodeoxyribonuclease RuvC [Gammaproteobacteria bacterium RIFOXYA12_FULL_61_12]
MESRRILGIDPGSRITGYAVIDSDGARSCQVESGCIRLSPEVTVAHRLGDIFRAVTGIIERCRPDEFAIEEVFLSKNASSALKLGQARGAAICAAATQGLPVHEYAARSVKQAVVGNGAAAKEQVQHMVKLLLNLREDLSPDQADALAVALAHAHSLSLNDRLTRMAGAVR